ncbi:MAG: hypothetical protein RLZZ370_1678 [Bacteroidota bacterium]|jgi:magnesium transporter
MQQLFSFRNFRWTNVEQPDQKELEALAAQYRLDFFQIQDSLQHGHLPKFERQPEYNFLILRAFTSNIEEGATTVSDLSNKIAFFYNQEQLITIHRSPFQFLQEVPKDPADSEALLLFLIGQMAETYQAPLDALDRQIEAFEQTIFLKDHSRISLEDLYYLKTQTRITKKLIQLFQQTLTHLEVSPVNRTALQDIKDRLVALVLSYDEVLENAHNLLHTYHSVNAQKSNDVMKLLTIFSAFFLPLTFVAGIYGMNFRNMPELEWTSGYYLAWGLMLLIAALVFIWFRRRRII